MNIPVLLTDEKKQRTTETWYYSINTSILWLSLPIK